MQGEITLPARAKINITMDVLSRRGDGYHNVDTVMQCVALCDDVRVSVAPGSGIRVRSGTRHVPSDMRNTAARAAAVFMSYATGGRAGIGGVAVDITLTKRIPAGAGLGGGSADAAAVLLALNELSGRGFTLAEIADIGAEVGSDVPFCVYGGAARATGRGEILRPLNPLPQCAIVIVKPPFSVSTAEAYAALGGVKSTRRPDTDGVVAALEAGDLEKAARRAYNVFEDALQPRARREIAAIKSRLLDFGALGASMTGTGSAVFALFGGAELAREAFAAMRGEYAECFLTGVG